MHHDGRTKGLLLDWVWDVREGVRDGVPDFDLSSGSVELPLTDSGKVTLRIVVVRIECAFFVFVF